MLRWFPTSSSHANPRPQRLPRTPPLTRSSVCRGVPHQLQRYQEQPHLLDHHLERLVHPLVDRIRVLRTEPNWDRPVFRRTMQLVYHITKVRGPKTIGKAMRAAGTMRPHPPVRR